MLRLCFETARQKKLSLRDFCSVCGYQARFWVGVQARHALNDFSASQKSELHLILRSENRAAKGCVHFALELVLNQEIRGAWHDCGFCRGKTAPAFAGARRP